MNIQYKPDNSSHQILEPGIGSHWLGRERYVVRGGAMVVIPLIQGDQVEIVDPEGLQPAHVIAFNSKGADCTKQLGLSVKSKGDQLAKLLARDTQGALSIRQKLKRFDFDLVAADAAILLAGETSAGATANFTSSAECIVIIGAPGEPMLIGQEGQDINLPATDLIVWITRANIHETIKNELPEPLADPVQDFRIHSATATAYEVKAGQYIQIIDVDGRQCSDFQCFDLAKLDQGIERCLDATVTRSLMGSAYPEPGLHAKFYDVDLAPVVEVVQDTCGRHDSFGLACTAKTYDEAGYPGHVNCSDNFNAAISDYPIAPRGGWMAMNLFFNTFFDDDYQLFSDEPWSRRR